MCFLFVKQNTIRDITTQPLKEKENQEEKEQFKLHHIFDIL